MVKRAAARSSPGDLSAAVRIAILHGPDRFRQDQAIQELKAALEAEHGADGYSVVRFDGNEGQRIVPDVMDECRSMSLMGGHKLVVVDNAENVLKADEDEEDGKPAAVAKGRRSGPSPKSAREVFEDYAKEPSPSATLVLRAGAWRPGKLDKAVEALGEQGAKIRCEPPNEFDAMKWAIDHCKARHGCAIQKDAAEALVQAVGANIGRIDSELEKLAVAAGGKGEPITLEHVESLTEYTRAEEKAWGIQDTLVSGDAAASLRALRDYLEVSRFDAVPLMWAYVDLARKLHGLSRGLAQGTPRNQLMGALKLWGPTVETLVQKAARVHPERAAMMFDAAMKADAAGKGGGMGDAERNLEVLTMRFARVMKV